MDGYELYKPFRESVTFRAVYDRLRSLSEEELRALRAWLYQSTEATHAWIRSAENDPVEQYIAKGYDVVPGRRDYREYQFDLDLLNDIDSLLKGEPLPEPPDEEPPGEEQVSFNPSPGELDFLAKLDAVREP